MLAGFAHCFGALSESAYFLCRTNDYYAPEHGRSLAWNNPTVVVDWPLAGRCCRPRTWQACRWARARCSRGYEVATPFLWERLGFCNPQASIKAAVGVGRPAHRTPAPARIAGPVLPCGSGIGRDAAAAVRRLRYRPLSGSQDSSRRAPTSPTECRPLLRNPAS